MRFRCVGRVRVFLTRLNWTTHGSDQLDLVYKRSQEPYLTTPRIFNFKMLIRKICPPKEPKEQPSRGLGPVTLPQEVVYEITSYIFDIKTLCSCSLTCYLWYLATVPRLHYSLTTSIEDFFERTEWPTPLQESYNLELLPFVKRFSIITTDFTPEQFGGCNLDYFSALDSLQELRIDCLQLSSFIPNIQQYFGHFSQTLLSLTLSEPKASYRQILYFTGHFKNLQDFKLSNFRPAKEDETTASLTLDPPFTPPLRGWLTLHLVGEGLVDEMITLYGRLHFRRVELLRVKNARQVLEACAETLETLKLHEGCIVGEYFFG